MVYKIAGLMLLLVALLAVVYATLTDSDPTLGIDSTIAPDVLGEGALQSVLVDPELDSGAAQAELHAFTAALQSHTARSAIFTKSGSIASGPMEFWM